MSALVFISTLALLLSNCILGIQSANQDRIEVISSTGANSSLPCTAKGKLGVNYIAVTWYKVGKPPSYRLNGLVRKVLPNDTYRWYLGLQRTVEMQESYTIVLPNVTCMDSGVYVCKLAAPIGEQNKEGRIRLTLTDCVEIAPVAISPETPLEEQVISPYMVSVWMIVLSLVILTMALIRFEITERQEAPPQEMGVVQYRFL